METSRLGIFLILLFLLSSCIISDGGFAPVENTDFVVMEKLSELDGVYRHISDASVDRSGGKIWVGLGEILWPDDRTALTDIVRFEIRAQGNDKFFLKAFDYNGMERIQKVYLADQDFAFSNGRVKFHRGNLLLQDNKDPILGPDVTMIEMGVDQERQLKVSITTTGAGLLLFIPGAIHQTTELKFLRTGD